MFIRVLGCLSGRQLILMLCYNANKKTCNQAAHQRSGKTKRLCLLQLSCMHLSTVFYVSFNCPTCVFQLSFSSLSTVLCSSFNCLLCIKEGVLHRKSRHDQSPGSMYDQVHGTTKSSQAPLFLATAISVLVLVNHGSGIKLTSTLHKSFWSCGVEPKADNHSTLISLQLRF